MANNSVENINDYLKNRIDWHKRMIDYHGTKRDLALKRPNGDIEADVHERIIEQYQSVYLELQGMKENLERIAYAGKEHE